MNALKIYILNNFKTIRLTLVVLLLCFGFSFKSTAQQILESPLSKNAFVSLLTVSSGNEVYAQYGHTAIRVCDPDKKLDVAFNYGLFDFHSPNFIWRFVKGQTDYMVGAYSNSEFLLEYLKENRAITEQVINLNAAEKEAVWQALVKNIQPENRTYRYNFIYNNCSTKPRDIIIQSLSGKVDYRWEGKFRSLRDEIHFFTEKFPWTQFGIDFVIGVKADYSANLNGQQFAPDLLRESFSKAIIVNNSGQIRPLVLKTEQPISIDKTQIEKPSWYPGPMIVMWFVFIVVAIISFLEIRNNKKYHMLNAVIFTVIGLIGTLIAFMVLFSEHPTTDVNYNLFWLHPFHLLYAIGLISPAFRRKAADIYLSINLPLQVFTLVGTLFLTQYFHPAMYPILLILMLRSGLAFFTLLKKSIHA